MRLFGHPVHPLLVHFPISFWILATVCDGLAIFGIAQAWPYGGLFLAIGLAFAVPAMISGLLELPGVADEAVFVINAHLLLMGSAWTVYLVALLTRLSGSTLMGAPNMLTVALSGFGFCLVSVGGWYGGQLVYHHGVGTRFQTRAKCTDKPTC